jgi:phenylalanyl-tRNA synthetase alpha chain
MTVIICSHVLVAGGKPVVKRKVNSITDTVREDLTAIAKDSGEQVESRLKMEYKKRKLVEEVVEKVYLVRQGPSFSTQVLTIQFFACAPN